MEGFNEKNLQFSTPASLKRRIKAAKATVKDKYTVYMGTAKKLVAAHNALLEAQEKNEYSPSAKNTAKCAVADNKFKAAAKEYLTYASLYESFVEDVIALYDELILNDRPSAARRARTACEKFEIQQRMLQEKISDVVKGVDGIPESVEDVSPTRVKENAEERAFAKPEPQPQYSVPEQTYRPYYMPPQGVTVAPMSIDISKTVEDAICASLEKFKEAFAKRIDECVNELPIPATPVVPVQPTVTDVPASNAPQEDVALPETEDTSMTEELASEADSTPESDTPPSVDSPVASAPMETEGVCLMEESVLQEECLIAEKLLKLTEDLKTLSDAISQLGAMYMELSDKQKDATEMQRKINDMQRAVSREIAGVQVNQKVIAQEQAAVSGEQTALIEEQKAIVENQKLVVEAQAGVTELQKTVILAHTALEEEMSGVLNAQKEAIVTQQTLVTAAAKNSELQQDVLEKQTELADAQKAVMSAQRALSRSHRSVAARVINPKAEESKPTVRKNKTPADEPMESAAAAEVMGED